MMLKRPLPPLQALRGFESAARHLSFTKAAEELFLTQGAVSRQVHQLEDHYGTPMFARFTRRIELTDAGAELAAIVANIFEQLSEAASQIERRKQLEPLTIMVLPTFGSAWLMPRLHMFTERHVDIEVRLHTSIDPVAFTSAGPDVAIRVGRVPGWHYDSLMPRIELTMVEQWDGIYIDVLFPDRIIPVCLPELRGDAMLTPDKLAAMPLIQTTSRVHAWPDWFRAHGVAPPPSYRAQVGHFFMAIQAARQGRGVALVPDITVAPELENGTLVEACVSTVLSAGHYCLLARDTALDRQTVQTFRRWLIAQVRERGSRVPDPRTPYPALVSPEERCRGR